MNQLSSAEHIQMMRSAKGALSGNWVSAAVGTLIYCAIMGVASWTYLGELIVTGPMTFGFVLFVMCLVDMRRSDLNLLFKGFERFVQTLVAGLLYSLAVGVGLMFLIVPGIILALGFGMTFFIMAEDPTISGVDALQRSWEMTRGYKWDFFCFNLRYIGWMLLGLITCGIAMLWVTPYMTAGQLNYYRRLRYGSF